MPYQNLYALGMAILVGLACLVQAQRGQYAYRVSEVLRTIDRHYVKPVNKEVLFEGALHGLTRRLDPFTNYIPPKYFGEFQQSLDQEFGGVGILVGIDEETGRLQVRMPLPNKPADEAGLRAGDVIFAIDGTDTAGLSTDDAVNLMRGEPGSSVRITIRREGLTDLQTYQVERAIIEVESVMGDQRLSDGHWDYRLAADPRFWLVRIVNFGEHTAEEMEEVLRKLRAEHEQGRVEGLILDLRGNSGGLLTAAVSLANMFMTSGSIVEIKGRSFQENESYTADPAQTIIPPGTLPIALLIDGDSASASEIVAACLQDHQLVEVIGSRSFGKGTVQKLFPLSAGRAALKLTVATYWRPSGQNIHRHVDDTEEMPWGVNPQEAYRVELKGDDYRRVWQARQARDVGEEPPRDPADPPEGPARPAVDTQLQRALEYLQQRVAQPQAA